MSSGLLADRRFAPMFWTQFSGAFNDNFFKNALVILVVFKVAAALPEDGTLVFGLGRTAFAPLAGAVFILPFFLFSAIGGQLAEDGISGVGVTLAILVIQTGIIF